VCDAGRIIGAVVVYHDVTEQLRHEAFERDARAEAEAATRMKDEFLAMLGHELRNPLQAIATSVASLHQAPLQEDSSRSLQIIDRQTRLLTRLVNDLLDVTRATTGTIRLERESVDLKDTLEHCMEQLAHAGRLAHHAIELQSESVWVNGDPVRLEQVVMNLLTNALRYTPSGGTIRVALKRDGDEAMVLVEDNGIGIEADLLPRVFDAFTQGERSPERDQGGLGIGLTLVQRLVHLHGGRVQAYSEGPGRGSRFVVQLPSTPAPTTEGPPNTAAR
jgi:signal transduction histidine kinase